MDAVQTNGSRTFVVGVDASPESEAAVTWVRSLAGADDRIVLVHSWQLPVVTAYDMVVTVDSHEIERTAKEWLDDRVAAYADDRIVPAVRSGHAGRAVVAEAEEREGSVVVVGHRGDSRVSLMLGSNANYVLHHTAHPVVIVRGDEVRPPRKVVVGVDDHDLDVRDDHENPSVRALRWAMTLPGVEEVRVIHAWFLPALAIGMFATVANDVDAMDDAAQRNAARVVSIAGPAPSGVKVTAEAVRGTPGFGLIEASRDADLVVVGSRGRGGFAELILGSTTTEVAAHAHAPVAVVR